MKFVPRGIKRYCLIISVAVLMSNVPNTLASALSESAAARLSLQRHYVIRVGQEIQNILCTASSQAELDSFVNTLLKGSDDPFIQYPVDYVPHHSLKLTLQTNHVVEKELQGKTLLYNYSSEAAQWRFNPIDSTLTTATNKKVPDFGMAVITEYCQNPQGWQFNEKLWFDKQWCCPWFQMVMPPFNGNLPAYCSSEKTAPIQEKEGYMKDLGRCYSQPSFEDEQLHIPRIVVSKEGIITIYQATLCQQSSEGIFSLCEHQALPETTPRPDDATYTDQTNLVTIPTVQVGTDNYTYQLSLNNPEGEMLFEVTQKTLLHPSDQNLTGWATQTRRDLQKYYTSLVWNELKTVIENSGKTEYTALKTEVEYLAKQLLRDKADPLIKEVHYVLEPHVTLRIIMHDKDLVDSELRGQAINYFLKPDKEKGHKGSDIITTNSSANLPWQISITAVPCPLKEIDSIGIYIEDTERCEPPKEGDLISPTDSIKDTATPPDSLLFDVGMCLITEYCNDPQDYTHRGQGMISDIDWCPSWLYMVMPLQEDYTPCSY